MTRGQQECLRVVQTRIAETGVCPSYDELRAALGLRSKSGVSRLLDGLEAQGRIRRQLGRVRSIEVIAGLSGELSPAEIAWCQEHADQVRALIAKSVSRGTPRQPLREVSSGRNQRTRARDAASNQLPREA